MRYTEYHAGVAVIKDKTLLPAAMKRLAAYEDYMEQLESKAKREVNVDRKYYEVG